MAWFLITSLEICCDSSWVPPWKRTQPQRHLSDALPSVPAMRLCVHPWVLSSRNSLTWNSKEYVMPSQATLELGSLKRLCLQPSSIRRVYPPCNHITRGHWEILSEVFPSRLHLRSALQVLSMRRFLKIQGKFCLWLFYPWALAELEVVEDEERLMLSKLAPQSFCSLAVCFAYLPPHSPKLKE